MRKLGFVILIFLQGCATGQIFTEAPAPLEGQALVYLLRGDVHYGGGYRTQFNVDDRIVARLYDGGYTWLHMAPGEHEIRVGRHSLDVNIVAAETYYFEFHQDNFSSSYGVETESSFKQYEYVQIQEQLSKSRYRESEDIATAEVNRYREFKNEPIENGAFIRISRDDSYAVVYPALAATIPHDAVTCARGRQSIPRELLDGRRLAIPSGDYVTLNVIVGKGSKIQGLNFSTTCSPYISFIPEAGRDYDLAISVEKADSGRLDLCRIEITDLSSNTPVEFLPRKEPPPWTGNSPKCSPSDLKEPVFITDFIEKMQCTYIKDSVSRKC